MEKRDPPRKNGFTPPQIEFSGRKMGLHHGKTRSPAENRFFPREIEIPHGKSSFPVEN